MRARLLLGLAIVLAATGCGGKLAPVSGTVTMNGEPLVGATVTFQPVAPEGSGVAGDSSVGKTDDKGKFTLKTIKGRNGAQVGKHRVSISLISQQGGDGDARPPRGGWPVKEKVPDKYNEKTTLTFDVLSGGTDRADFPLKSP